MASSAPVYAKAAFYGKVKRFIYFRIKKLNCFSSLLWFCGAEYYEVVTNSLNTHDAKCSEAVKSAFADTEELLASDGGPQKIRSMFKYVVISATDLFTST